MSLSERFITICAREAFHLAAYYPIVWRFNEVGRLSLCVMRSLAPDQEEIKGIRTTPYDALPLLVQAYPFRFRNHDMGDFDMGLERVFPKAERDVGAYVYDQLGNLGLGAQLKIDALQKFREDYEFQFRLGDFLEAQGLLEPVRLPSDLESRFKIPELHAIRVDADWTQVLEVFDRHQWPSIIRLLAAQRISLFRASALIAAQENP